PPGRLFGLWKAKPMTNMFQSTAELPPGRLHAAVHYRAQVGDVSIHGRASARPPLELLDGQQDLVVVSIHGRASARPPHRGSHERGRVHPVSIHGRASARPPPEEQIAATRPFMFQSTAELPPGRLLISSHLLC